MQYLIRLTLKNFIFLGNVDSIGQWSFLNCHKLATIIYFGTKDPTIPEDAFTNGKEKISLKVSKRFVDENHFRPIVNNVANNVIDGNLEFDFTPDGIGIGCLGSECRITKNNLDNFLTNFGFNVPEYIKLMVNFIMVTGPEYVFSDFLLQF